MRRRSSVPSGRWTTREKTIIPPEGLERTSLCRQLGSYSPNTARIASSRAS
jgi:hypothetical protein